MSTFYRIQSQAEDFQSQPLYITANFVRMTAVVSNAYVPDQDNQLWQKVPGANNNYALVSAHTVNGQEYCMVPQNGNVVLAAFDPSSPGNFAYWTDGGGNWSGMIMAAGSMLNIPGNTYYSGLQLILFQPQFNAENEIWMFVS